tara:strand:+ start:5262 stop:5489 length:228 start_codon:yes stop_codon:yes gene_type:complete
VKYKAFMPALRKQFKGNKLALRKKGDIETIVVNGNEIDMAWKPHLNKLQGEDSINVLYRDCVISIKRLLEAQPTQ